MIDNGLNSGRSNPNSFFSPIWRLLLYAISIIGSYSVIISIIKVILLFNGNSNTLENSDDLGLVGLLIMQVPFALVSIFITLLFVAFVDRRPVETIGISRKGSWVAELILGLGLGIILPALIFFVSYAAGWATITGSLFNTSPWHIFSSILMALVLMILIGVSEEFVTRGYILQTLCRGYGQVAALIISSSIFGLLHLANPGSSISGIIGVILAGLMMGYGYLATRRLWLPMGFHFAWNFALGPIFGFPVSGVSLFEESFIRQDNISAPLWTGGEFGPEAGLLGYLAIIMAVIIIWVFSKTWYNSGKQFLPASYDETISNQDSITPPE
ncbi:MAG: CPBP family intramembrane glutamic endopeptidase [Armatimonadota bacterium]